jgi:hypothetical protein
MAINGLVLVNVCKDCEIGPYSTRSVINSSKYMWCWKLFFDES